MISQPVITALRAASVTTGDASGNCDEALHMAHDGTSLERLAERMEWAEENARAALNRIAEARAAIAKAIAAEGAAA